MKVLLANIFPILSYCFRKLFQLFFREKLNFYCSWKNYRKMSLRKS